MGCTAQDKYRKTEKFRITSLKNHFKRHYNISLDDYEEMLEAQNYACKICGSIKANREWKTKIQRLDLFVDHCHTTKKVRGLLCNKCNVGLAMFNDDINLFTNAISYIKDHM